MSSFAIRGRFVHGVPGKPGALELVPDGLITIRDGVIEKFETTTDGVTAGMAALGGNVQQLADDEFCVPGLIDTHVHAPQYQFNGTATDLPLMEWLQHYTFPAERRMSDVELAKKVYSRLVRRLLTHGTTTAVYFASIHLEATKALVDICRALGQRAFVGKVAMDQYGAPEYEETTEESLRDTEALIHYCHGCEPAGDEPVRRLVNPVVTPRFIPTCSAALLQGLGDLAKQYRATGCWVQSHCAESFDEMAFVESLHPGSRDTEIFDSVGLLTDRCVMAHCVHLTAGELALFAERHTGVACCPLSNSFFAGGVFGLRRAQRAGVRIGLGTDVAGGYSPSMLNSCRTAVVASKLAYDATIANRAANDTAAGEAVTADGQATDSVAADGGVVVDYKLAFWTATIGGAATLGLEDHLGHFAPGKQFDAAVVTRAADVYDTFPPPSAEALAILAADFERYTNLGDDRNISRVYVRGRLVKGDEEERVVG